MLPDGRDVAGEVEQDPPTGRAVAWLPRQPILLYAEDSPHRRIVYQVTDGLASATARVTSRYHPR